MKKFSTSKTDKFILRFIIKITLSTIFSILLFTFIFSEIIYKFDLSFDFENIISIVICALCAFFIATVSLSGVKNNQIVMGIICQIPLILYSLFNLIFNENTLILFIIKLTIIVLVASFCGVLKIRTSKRFKV